MAESMALESDGEDPFAISSCAGVFETNRHGLLAWRCSYLIVQELTFPASQKS